MMTAHMTYHVTEERLDRVMAIAQHIGWGTELVSVTDQQSLNHVLILTSTGVLLVKSHKGHLITAYVPTMGKVRAIYATLGYDHIPDPVYFRLQKSIKMMKKMGYY